MAQVGQAVARVGLEAWQVDLTERVRRLRALWELLDEHPDLLMDYQECRERIIDALVYGAPSWDEHGRRTGPRPAGGYRPASVRGAAFRPQRRSIDAGLHWLAPPGMLDLAARALLDRYPNLTAASGLMLPDAVLLATFRRALERGWWRRGYIWLLDWVDPDAEEVDLPPAGVRRSSCRLPSAWSAEAVRSLERELGQGAGRFLRHSWEQAAHIGRRTVGNAPDLGRRMAQYRVWWRWSQGRPEAEREIKQFRYAVRSGRAGPGANSWYGSGGPTELWPDSPSGFYGALKQARDWLEPLPRAPLVLDLR
jgi:hypothetical protein